MTRRFGSGLLGEVTTSSSEAGRRRSMASVGTAIGIMSEVRAEVVLAPLGDDSVEFVRKVGTGAGKAEATQTFGAVTSELAAIPVEFISG